MGLCGSNLTEEQKLEKLRSREIDRSNRNFRDGEARIKKLLLLGAGESGKSTLFKQMITLYGKGFSEDDRRQYRSIVFSNTISSMNTLLRYSNSLGLPDCKIHGLEESRRFVMTAPADAVVDATMAQHIEALWRDPGIQTTYLHRAEFQLNDSAAYFFDRLSAMSDRDYCPNQQDVLRSRVRTTGIVETAFETQNHRFKMFDVGGQRNERKKWIHCFDSVTAVIFVAALSEYDQKLYEDENTNRMEEALNLFDEICNSRWFVNTSMILFLNKKDLFAQKLERVPLSVCFNAYTAGNDYDAACKYITNVFESKNRCRDKEVYTNVTCATDSDNIFHVFNAVKDIIIRNNLREGGLLD